MRKPQLKTLLAAAVIGSAGSFAVAQQDPALQVDRQSDDRAVISIEQRAQQQSQQARNQQTLRGTIVSLETYLRDGESAARNETAQSAGTERPMALLADDGELYIILDKPMQQRSQAGMASGDAGGQSGMSGDAQARVGGAEDTTYGMTDPEDPQKITQSPGYELPASDGDRSADADSNVGTSSERSSRQALDTDADRDPSSGRVSLNTADRDDIGNQQSPAPGRERHTNRANMSATDSQRRAEDLAETRADERRADAAGESDQQVYGMAAGEQADRDKAHKDKAHKDKSHKDKAHKSKLKVGQQVSLSGEVFERGDVKGVAVHDVQSTQ